LRTEGEHVTAIRYPTSYRQIPRGPEAPAAIRAECDALFARATELDAAQRTLADELGDVRTQLAELHIVMWPRVDPKDLVHGFRFSYRGGPPAIPPVARTALPLSGNHLRSAILAILARNARPTNLVELHRELHLHGYAIASRRPVKQLANSLGYEVIKGRAVRVERGVYRLGRLNPGESRRITRLAESFG
jgi:hypothetical protein